MLTTQLESQDTLLTIISLVKSPLKVHFFLSSHSSSLGWVHSSPLSSSSDVLVSLPSGCVSGRQHRVGLGFLFCSDAAEAVRKVPWRTLTPSAKTLRSTVRHQDQETSPSTCTDVCDVTHTICITTTTTIRYRASLMQSLSGTLPRPTLHLSKRGILRVWPCGDWLPHSAQPSEISSCFCVCRAGREWLHSADGPAGLSVCLVKDVVLVPSSCCHTCSCWECSRPGLLWAEVFISVGQRARRGTVETCSKCMLSF